MTCSHSNLKCLGLFMQEEVLVYECEDCGRRAKVDPTELPAMQGPIGTPVNGVLVAEEGAYAATRILVAEDLKRQLESN